MDYYRIKSSWRGLKADGTPGKLTSEELVYAESYGDAEHAAYTLAEHFSRQTDLNVRITKTKIGELVKNDVPALSLVSRYEFADLSDESSEEQGLYSVKVLYTLIDERTGKEKHSPSVLYMPASSASDAARRVSEYLNGTLADFTIRDVKYDKAQGILWPAANSSTTH